MSSYMTQCLELLNTMPGESGQVRPGWDVPSFGEINVRMVSGMILNQRYVEMKRCNQILKVYLRTRLFLVTLHLVEFYFWQASQHQSLYEL